MYNLKKKFEKTNLTIVYFTEKFPRKTAMIRVFSSDGQYLNNRMFLSINYRLIVAPRKFHGLKTNICRRREASRANILVLRTSNFQNRLETHLIQLILIVYFR